MVDIKKIISLINLYFDKHRIAKVEANEIAKYLDKHGALNFSTKGQPFRKLLREGKIPNAEKIGGNWYIHHSKEHGNLSKPKMMNSSLIRIKEISSAGNPKGLSAISDTDSEILILGTLPGNKSLKENKYYTNPTNKFWEILSKLYKEHIPESYEERISWLKKHKIALWDVLKSANREGSLDNSILNPEPNDISNFISSHNSLRVIVLNGTNDTKKYFNAYVDAKKIPESIKILPLPSTSSSNTHFTFEEKIKLWSVILT